MSEQIHKSRKLFFPIAGKGGVGKSAFTINLAKIVGAKTPIRLYDFEVGMGTGLSRFFPRATKLDLNSVEQLDRIINDFENSPEIVSIVDFPANSGHNFLNWVADVPWKELQDKKIRLWMFASATDDSDSLRLALPWIRSIGVKADYVLVKNQHLGSDFLPWMQSKQGIEFLENHQPLTICFPSIPSKWAVLLENSGKTIFDDVTKIGGFPKLKFMDRCRLDRLRTIVAKNFQPLVDKLIT